MDFSYNLVLVVHILVGISVIGLVLIQHGKGADMGASFGSGASGSLFGATGSANFMSRSTAVCAGVFFVCTLALAFLTNSATMRAPAVGTSVLDRAAVSASGPALAASAVLPAPTPTGLPAPMVAPAPAAASAPAK